MSPSAERQSDAAESGPSTPGRSWTSREAAGVYLRGFCMGAADAVPGVSGGTIALITGIYERLITALTAVSPLRLWRVASGVGVHRSGARRRARQALIEMDALFLLILGVGLLSAVVAITSAVNFAVRQYPVATFGFFLGLIGASAVVLAGDVTIDRPGDALAGAAGFVAAYVVSGQAATELGHGLPVVFLAGAIAVSAMILPGISGSLLLLLLGQYTYMVGTLAAVRDGIVGLATGGSLESVVEPATVAGTFVVGAVVGLFTVAHAVRYALDRRRQATIAFLVALIVGALRAPIIRIDLALAEAGRGWDGEVLATVTVATLVGAFAVLLLERLAGGIDIQASMGED